MSRITSKLRQDVRTQAEQFLTENGFTEPPLVPEDALSARNLEVMQLSLDDLLVNANLPPDEQKKVQAVLDIKSMAVAFKIGLPQVKQNWGSLHEVGHEYLPWHRELLYFCPLLWLPAYVQEQMEAEADIFAAESFFYGSKFNKLVSEGELGLTTAKQMADEVYKTSYHSTFVHMVELSEIPCCLLVWKPDEDSDDLSIPRKLRLHYYVPSKGFRMHFPPKQEADDEVVLGLYANSSPEVVKHELIIDSKSGRQSVAPAESFFNSYNVFTLVHKPKLSSGS